MCGNTIVPLKSLRSRFMWWSEVEGLGRVGWGGVGGFVRMAEVQDVMRQLTFWLSPIAQ